MGGQGNRASSIRQIQKRTLICESLLKFPYKLNFTRDFMILPIKFHMRLRYFVHHLKLKIKYLNLPEIYKVSTV